MINYFLKRFILFIPTLFIIAILLFYLGQFSSGNPILDKIEQQSKGNQNLNTSELFELKKKFNLQLPVFYFNIHRKTSCPNSNLFIYRNTVAIIEQWAFDLGSWQKAQELYEEIKVAKLSSANTLLKSKSIAELKEQNSSIEFSTQEALKLKIEALNTHFSWNNFLPTFKWNGNNNQFHLWLSKLITGDFGTALTDGSSIRSKVFDALQWTLIISLCSLVLSLLIAIPSAVYAAANPNGLFDKSCNFLFFGFYALPTFWIGTLLILFFCSGEYFSLFPTYGLGQLSENMSLVEVFKIRFNHLILPVTCCAYGSLAFIYRQLKSSLSTQLDAEYIKTAKSKGLNQSKVLWKHAFKNASFPLLTIIGNAIPALFSGAFVVEYIFSIPGMGKLTVDSFLARDFPVIYIIVFLIAIITLFAAWLIDLTYHIADPRFRINTENGR